ncbi:MAG: sigma-54-dependent Fis family transcriptional regulator [Gemmatimonadetes bacterium]|nr:sigma-54-dependent Fis family transcriptional regulator [Gemmatimonadota bacterium]
MSEENGKVDSRKARVLVVEDEEIVGDLLVKVLGEEGYAVESVASGEDALKALDRELYDLVLLDLNLPGMYGMNVLSAAPALQTDAQFIVMTAFGSVDTAVEAMRLGAFDYINKPFRSEELLLTLERALHETELRREVAQLRRRAGEGVRGNIVGKSPPIERMFDLIERVAATRATVLITGETGTGKELVARVIHDLSDRARKPFIPTNCSALPETLLESELFGHMKGSFTGAIASRRGLFEEASGGTLFLDEVSTVSPAIQVKLLRVLQDRRIQRVGGGQFIPVDFRLLVATNVDLSEEVATGRFREDLFYRLNVFPIRVPPLRERKSDIPLLANYFRTRLARENGVEPPEITADTMRRLMAYDWPGNVRELENFIERAVIMHAGARSMPFEAPPGQTSRSERQLLDQARQERWSLERLEREYLLDMLDEAHGHKGHAAEILGIDRRTLYRKLKRYQKEGILPELDLTAD